MMGLGPHGSSVLERCGRPAPPFPEPFSMMLEQQDRGEQRKLKAIWHREHNKTPKKPEAPVTALPKKKGFPRLWVWMGETIESKGLAKGASYVPEYIRKAGFKLPKLKKDGK